VVNVLDGRIPDHVPSQPITGQVEVAGGTVADERSGAASLNGGAGRIAWHADFLMRETDDYEIPGPTSVLANSALESEAGAFGVSWVGDRSYVGVSVSGFDTLYGVPGGHHEEEGEESIRIDLEQRRADLRGEYRGFGGFFRGVKYRFGAADYEHVELEGAEVGTRFTNDSWEGRLELVQSPRGRLSGSIGAQVASNDFAAIGEEAFVPPSVTDSWAVFAFEELALRDGLRFQFGGRFERQDVEPEGDAAGRSEDGVSGSLGLVWDPSEDYSVGVSVARSERLATATELFADGPHIATRAFEIGNPALDSETSLGVDLSLRKRAGRLTGVLNLFANRFDGYIFESFTGEEEDGLQVIRFEQADAEFYGAELAAVGRLVQVGEAHLDLRFGADLVRAELTGSGSPLPRIPPLSAHLGLDFHHGPFRATLEGIRAEEQDRVAENETPTGGYTLLNAALFYRFLLGRTVTDVIVRGRSLTDEEARNHVSFLKDVAPLPGRDLSLGLRVGF
jgi:iron complex outermembrane receptor protein